jgi:cytochrome P450
MVIEALTTLRAFQRDLIQALTERLGDGSREVADLQIGPQRATFVMHPEGVEHVLVRNLKNYSKETRGYTMLRKILGRGLVTSEGELWRRQRRIAQPAFHRQRIASFAAAMVTGAERMIDARWLPAARTGAPIDVADEMMRITLEIVSETLLGLTAGRDADAVGRAVPVVLEHVVYRIQHMLSPHELVPTRRNRRYRRAMATLDELVNRIIAARRDGQTPPADDLLQMFMDARDEETGETMDDRQLRDEVMTMYLAGHETTAVALSWTLYLLHENPEWDARVREELDRVLGGRSPGLDDLAGLEVTRRVIEESMRLYPPVYFMGRTALADDEIAGHRIPKGRLVFVSPWLTHRRPDLYPDPERFDPDRFLPERRAALPRLAYFPFSAGQRKCIGDQFALIEAQLVLATVLPRFRFALARPTPVKPQGTITLRPAGGLTMRLTEVADQGMSSTSRPTARSTARS